MEASCPLYSPLSKGGGVLIHSLLEHDENVLSGIVMLFGAEESVP